MQRKRLESTYFQDCNTFSKTRPTFSFDLVQRGLQNEYTTVLNVYPKVLNIQTQLEVFVFENVLTTLPSQKLPSMAISSISTFTITMEVLFHTNTTCFIISFWHFYLTTTVCNYSVDQILCDLDATIMFSIN